MEGGTTFHFITGGIHAALSSARDSAGESTLAVAGGASTINQFMNAGLLDELRLHVAPILLGTGERLFDGVAGQEFTAVHARVTGLVMHTVYRVGRRTEN